MSDTLELNRLEYNILKCLYKSECTDQYHSITITELMGENEELSNARMTLYRKLNKLNKAGYIRKGCLDNHADTFYLTDRSLKILERKDTETTNQNTIKSNNISHDNNPVRTKLLDIMDRGMMLKAVAVNSGISESELSRFKNGVDALKESDLRTLAEYLDVLFIPRWNIEGRGFKRQLTARERLLESRNRQNEEKPKRKRSQITLDLLDELDS